MSKKAKPVIQHISRQAKARKSLQAVIAWTFRDKEGGPGDWKGDKDKEPFIGVGAVGGQVIDKA